jgi:hypothetical protein
MSKHRAAIALSLTALAVAVLGQTSIGHAAVSAVRVAVFAENAGKVNNIKASRKPMPGRLVPLNARGKLPSSVLPSASVPGGYTHTLIVSPEPNPVDAGRTLREVVSGIADPSASNPYLVKIEPGVYDLEANSLFMRAYVDIEGSGEGITTVTSSLSTGSGTIVGTDNSELRYVTVKNRGGGDGPQVAALFSESKSPRYTHVTAIASGGTENNAIHISNGAPVLSYVTAIASGGSRSTGVANFGGLLTASNSTFSAADAANTNLGVLSTFGGTVRAASSTISASGGVIAVGLRTNNGTHTVANVTVAASGATESYGMYNGWRVAAPVVNAHQSRISGGTYSIYSIGGTIQVGASQLAGPVGTLNIGFVRCAASYDATFNPLQPNCVLSAVASEPASSRRER